MPISVLGLTTRTRNALLRHRIYEGEYDHLEPVHVRSRLPYKTIRIVGDILDMEPEEWMDIRNFGKKSRLELLSSLIDIRMKYENKTGKEIEMSKEGLSDADHKMYHYISGIVDTLEAARNYDKDFIELGSGRARIEMSLQHASEIKEYLQTLLEIKIMFIEGIK